jgi:hypothetical protein
MKVINIIVDQLKSLEFCRVLIELGGIKPSEQNWERSERQRKNKWVEFRGRWDELRTE